MMDKYNIEDIYELSPLQQGMLFHSVLEPSAGVYFCQFRSVLHGDLDLPSLARAWREVIARYPTLRTSFHWEDIDKPLQVVHREAELALDQEDWRGHTREETGPWLQALLAADRERGFDLKQAPLMRCLLIRLEDRAHWFIWSYHHLILDGWSVQTVLQELLTCYDAFARGRASTVRGGPPFSRYISWLQRQDPAGAEAFWREALAGFTAPTPLSMGGSPAKDPVKAKEIDTQACYLAPEVTAALQSFARRGQLTVNTLVQTVWAILLCRYSGERDVVFGSVVSGRPTSLPEVEAMVGLFINTLPLRARFSGRESLAAWMGELQAQQAVARRFESTPLLEIRRWSEVAAATPLFESILIFQNVPLSNVREIRFADLRLGEVHFLEKTSLPLTLESWVGEQLVVRARYDRRRFGRTAIRRMLGHFSTVIEAIPAHSDRRPWELPLLSFHEQHQILVDWNDTAWTPAFGLSLPDLLVPHLGSKAPAVIAGDRQLSYPELERRANQLARRLRSLGVGRRDLVGICLEPSADLPIVILAILKAGAAYLPLDPSYPAERLRFMIEDSRVRWILSQGSSQPQLIGDSRRVVALDAEWDAVSAMSGRRFFSDSSPADLAYVIYTSGSTGKPKGVEVPRGAVLNFLRSMAHSPGMGARDEILVVTTLSFDIAVLELLLPLMVGARLHLVKRQDAMDGRRLREELAASGVTVMQATPTTWRMLLETGWKGNPRLKALCGGEALAPQLAADLSPKVASLWNMYGPTETTIWSTVERVRSDGVSLGRPIANTEIYVAGRTLEAQPAAAPGELLIGGAGVARGYLGRASSTAEKFVPDPFGRRPGARLYRTGDRVRSLTDGRLEFLGRIDHQVKVRGHRIEPGEAEGLLLAHPGVRQAVVVARPARSGDAALVAYLVAAQDRPAPVELRNLLKKNLPDYLIPASFVFLRELPLMPNGKLNRALLPEPDSTRPELEAAFMGPRTPTEEQVAEIWREVLGVDRVGVHDDFFESGGHSLSAMRVLSRIHQAFALELPLESLFEGPTVAEIGLLITEKQLQAASESETFALLEEIRELSDEDLDELLHEEKQVLTANFLGEEEGIGERREWPA